MWNIFYYDKLYYFTYSYLMTGCLGSINKIIKITPSQKIRLIKESIEGPPGKYLIGLCASC